jgi:hypothetical protein
MVGSIGWPGFVAWEARAKLMELTLAGPLLAVVMVGALVPSAIYVRLVIVGVGRRSAAVRAGSDEIPRWPAPRPARAMVGQSELERVFEKGSHLLAAVLDIIWAVPAALRLNRTLIAGILVVALSGLGVVIAYGGLGVIDAARAAPGEATGPNASGQPGLESASPGLESEPPGSGPSFQPVPTPP